MYDHTTSYTEDPSACGLAGTMKPRPIRVRARAYRTVVLPEWEYLLQPTRATIEVLADPNDLLPINLAKSCHPPGCLVGCELYVRPSHPRELRTRCGHGSVPCRSPPYHLISPVVLVSPRFETAFSLAVKYFTPDLDPEPTWCRNLLRTWARPAASSSPPRAL